MQDDICTFNDEQIEKYINNADDFTDLFDRICLLVEWFDKYTLNRFGIVKILENNKKLDNKSTRYLTKIIDNYLNTKGSRLL